MTSALLLRRGLISERLGPFLKYLVELSDSIAQLAWITLVEESLPESAYLCLIHNVNSLALRRLRHGTHRALDVDGYGLGGVDLSVQRSCDRFRILPKGRVVGSIPTGASVDNIDCTEDTGLLYVAAAEAAQLMIARIDDAEDRLYGTNPTKGDVCIVAGTNGCAYEPK